MQLASRLDARGVDVSQELSQFLRRQGGQEPLPPPPPSADASDAAADGHHKALAATAT
jgi:hypothetical protein